MESLQGHINLHEMSERKGEVMMQNSEPLKPEQKSSSKKELATNSPLEKEITALSMEVHDISSEVYKDQATQGEMQTGVTNSAAKLTDDTQKIDGLEEEIGTLKDSVESLEEKNAELNKNLLQVEQVIEDMYYSSTDVKQH